MDEIYLLGGKIQLESWKEDEFIRKGQKWFAFREIFFIKNNELIRSGTLFLKHDFMSNTYDISLSTIVHVEEQHKIVNYIWKCFYFVKKLFNNKFSYNIDEKIVKNELNSLITRVNETMIFEI